MPSKTPRLARYADKAPTDLQKRFTKWIKKETGVDVDEQSVALSVALRMEFQRSEENQAVLKTNRERAVADKAAKTTRKAATPAAPKAPAAKRRRSAAKAEPVTAEPAAPTRAEADAEIEAADAALAAEAPEPRPEPQFDDPKADAAVEASQKAEAAPAAAPKRRRAKATMVSGS